MSIVAVTWPIEMMCCQCAHADTPGPSQLCREKLDNEINVLVHMVLCVGFHVKLKSDRRCHDRRQ